MTGPRSSEPGYDYIMQGLTGWMNLTGEPDGPPTKSGLSLVDYSGGLIASVAFLLVYIPQDEQAKVWIVT